MFGATEGLLIGAALLAVGGALWSRFHAGRRAVRRTRAVLAQVVDIGAVDVSNGDHHQTLHRVVLLFMSEGGEPVAVDKTARFTRAQLDALIPGHMVTIVHEPGAPENFDIDFAGAHIGDPAGGQPVKTVYGPPS